MLTRVEKGIDTTRYFFLLSSSRTFTFSDIRCGIKFVRLRLSFSFSRIEFEEPSEVNIFKARYFLENEASSKKISSDVFLTYFMLINTLVSVNVQPNQPNSSLINFQTKPSRKGETRSEILRILFVHSRLTLFIYLFIHFFTRNLAPTCYFHEKSGMLASMIQHPSPVHVQCRTSIYPVSSEHTRRQEVSGISFAEEFNILKESSRSRASSPNA